MINFLLYEKDKNLRDIYISLITSYIGEKKEKYKIITIDDISVDVKKIINPIDGKKIFLIDSDSTYKNGIHFAKEIRSNGDWLSPIIIFTDNDYISNYKNVIMVDFIVKDEKLKSKFIDSIRVAHQIVKTHKAFTFQYNGEIYNIPYHDILFFEKDLNNNYTNIVTYNKKYTIRKSLVQIEKILNNDSRFIKSHRSYFVNIHNISKINLSNGTIEFKGNNVALISRSKKKIIKDCLGYLMID